jgi:hypothetical protein
MILAKTQQAALEAAERAVSAIRKNVEV